MIYISHRGNIDGPNPSKENRISYIEDALEKKYEVEIDVRGNNGHIFLGHDNYQEEVNFEWLSHYKMWVHVKNHEALEMIIDWNRNIFNNRIHFFWHQEDDRTMTSKGMIWTYPGKYLVSGSIAVLPELAVGWNLEKAKGICSDYIKHYANNEKINL